MITMLDALYPNNLTIPLQEGATAVAGYIDLADAWAASAWNRLNRYPQFYIARDYNTEAGNVLDCENGLSTWPPGNNEVQWVQRRRAAGVEGGIYCSSSAWATFISLFNQAAVPQPQYWIAHYDNIPALPVLSGITANAKQYWDTAQYDISIVGNWKGFTVMTDPFNDSIQPVDATGKPVGNPVTRGWMLDQIYEGLFYHVGTGPSIVDQLATQASAISTLEAKVAALETGQVAEGPYYLTSTPPSTPAS